MNNSEVLFKTPNIEPMPRFFYKETNTVRTNLNEKFKKAVNQ